MNLVIDMGNTFSKTGLFEGDRLIETHWQLSDTHLADYVAHCRPEQLMVSSVRYAEEGLKRQFQQYSPYIQLLTPNTPVPIQKLYDTPQTLGADRVAAAVGAKVCFPMQNCLVIDMGTCITYDMVDADNRFHGGIISPGLSMRFKAMHTFTQRLPLVEPAEIPPLIGKSTTHAMQSGVMNGLLAELNGFIEAYKGIFADFQVLLCGGDMHFFESRLKSQIFVVPELVLLGLNRILRYQSNV